MMLPRFDNTAIAFQYKSNAALRHAQVLFTLIGLPWLTRAGSWFTEKAIRYGLPVRGLIRRTIFRQFCGGETLDEAADTADLLAPFKVGVILDYGVEGKDNEAAYDLTVPEFIKAVTCAASRTNIPFISLKVTGFARFSLLEKIHAGAALTDEEKDAWQRVVKRVDDICAAAYQLQVKVLIDAEETWIQEGVNQLSDAMMEKYNREEAVVYNTFQMYCHGTLPWLKEEIDKAVAKGYVHGIKLVRGAYMEKERKRAAEQGYPSPIQPDKQATDSDYDAAVLYCLQHLDNLSVFIGTHNENSCLLAAQYMQERGIPHSHPRVHFSQLFGMSDNISFNLGHEGYNVSKYLPYGPVNDVIPYLLRRAQENTSVAGQTGRELALINKEIARRKQ